MKRDVIVEIIRDFHERKLPKAVQRDIQLPTDIDGKAIAVIGPRRAGKTYLLFQTLAMIPQREDALYVNLEDDRLFPADISTLDEIVRTYYEMYPDKREKTVHLFFDEVQNVDGWERFIRRMLDGGNIRVYLTGSSSHLLAREISTSMRGRAISYSLLPFSFREFLRAKKVEYDDYMSSAKKSAVMNALMEYVKFGGFPEIVLQTDENLRIKVLKEYVDVMLMRDIIERHRIRGTKVMRLLMKAAFASFSKEFSVHKFFNDLRSQGIKLSKTAVYDYMQYLEDAFAIIPVRRFSYSLRDVERSLPKIYPVDNGYIAQSLSEHSDNVGRLMEAVVAQELFRLTSERPRLSFYYWKSASGYEVDFILKDGNVVEELIQVAYDISDIRTKEREIKGLLKASKELRCDALTVITWDFHDEEVFDGKTIRYLPIVRFLMNGLREEPKA